MYNLVQPVGLIKVLRRVTYRLGDIPVKNELTTLAKKKNEATPHTGVQACAISSMHVHVISHGWLSQFLWPGYSTESKSSLFACMNCAFSDIKIERWHLLGLKHDSNLVKQWRGIGERLEIITHQGILGGSGDYINRAQKTCGNDDSECLYNLLRIWVTDDVIFYRNLEYLHAILRPYTSGLPADAVMRLPLFQKNFYNAEVKIMNV